MKFEGYAGLRHGLLIITMGGMERLKLIVLRTGPVVSFAFFTSYDLVMGSEDEASWYGASLKKIVTLSR